MNQSDASFEVVIEAQNWRGRITQLEEHVYIGSSDGSVRGTLTSGFWRDFSDARSLNRPFRGVRIELPSEAEASSAEEQLAKE
ncbi:hypothetical protein RISK_006509 [Rhodopirellula islandica]|uniref:Uncharacterized protein n=1 Tax=Rhodopirellula islandica TaxID=595434 RepID=A0A0J1B422_RHOIS|nr:hypothetical protein [Rhodopirellula islandica]KLU01353.1 hypothetical protein RISK_006509 [Rhodopirellula islandica]